MSIHTRRTLPAFMIFAGLSLGLSACASADSAPMNGPASPQTATVEICHEVFSRANYGANLTVEAGDESSLSATTIDQSVAGDRSARMAIVSVSTCAEGRFATVTLSALNAEETGLEPANVPAEGDLDLKVRAGDTVKFVSGTTLTIAAIDDTTVRYRVQSNNEPY